MFGGGGDFWVGLPMEPAPPAYPYPAPLAQYRAPSPLPAAAWSAAENRVFEAALVEFEEGRPDRWQRIAERIPGKAPWDVAAHYGRLERDLRDIEAGVIAIPDYADDCLAHTPPLSVADQGQPQQQQQRKRNISFGGSRGKAEDRKKGCPWTEPEHKRFLEGLEKYGKGDWRSISRNAVVTRTPTQVASHAQKFFLRQSAGGKKDRRRTSIHDVTKP